MKISSVSPAKRCEVCHQEDSLDLATGGCARCTGAGIQVTNVQVDLAAPVLAEISLKEESQHKGRVARAEALVIKRIVQYGEAHNVSEQQLMHFNFSELMDWYRRMLAQVRLRSKVCRAATWVMVISWFEFLFVSIPTYFLLPIMFLSVIAYWLARDTNIKAHALIEAHELLQKTHGHGYIYKLLHPKGEKK